MTPTPARRQAKAAEHDLGDCVTRYRRRPGLTGTFFAFAPLAGGILIGTLGGDPVKALGVVLFLWPPLFLAWCYSTRKRLDGGIYVFTGGFAEVHGRKIPHAITWAEVRAVRYKSVEHWLNFIPVAYVAKCTIELRDGGVIELDGSYRKLERLAEDLHHRSSA
ncbi:hypothetical protein [Amycolatopsis sp. lyj-84]|uniref:hypothetical protein n=1 Tax=Amycolatopsis sp. lyj-84 TaxID=2789284 RepID=UPI00397C77E7